MGFSDPGVSSVTMKESQAVDTNGSNGTSPPTSPLFGPIIPAGILPFRLGLSFLNLAFPGAPPSNFHHHMTSGTDVGAATSTTTDDVTAGPGSNPGSDALSILAGSLQQPNSRSPTSSRAGSRGSADSSASGGLQLIAGGPRDKQFMCGVCNRSFGYKHVLQNHERTHTGEKPFECKECHKRFTRDHHLKTHMRLHTGEKPYSCTHCERQFVQVANLRRHLRVHTGERPYACELCTSRFSDSNQLKAHMLIHKGEKPFECDLCMGRFRRRHHLIHHKCPMNDNNAKAKPSKKSPCDLYPVQPMVPYHPEVSSPISVVPALGETAPLPQPPEAHAASQLPPKSRRKPRHTIRILNAAQQRELFLHEEEDPDEVQTEPLDMSISQATTDSLTVIRRNNSYRYPAIEGVLDLSSSRSDSELDQARLQRTKAMNHLSSTTNESKFRSKIIEEDDEDVDMRPPLEEDDEEGNVDEDDDEVTSGSEMDSMRMSRSVESLSMVCSGPRNGNSRSKSEASTNGGLHA